jgi:hypothetical protein
MTPQYMGLYSKFILPTNPNRFRVSVVESRTQSLSLRLLILSYFSHNFLSLYRCVNTRIVPLSKRKYSYNNAKAK